MAAARVQAGDAFLIDPTGGTNLHLWFVIHVWCPDYSYDDCAIIVSVTTVTKFADRTCLLDCTDVDAHEFIDHESYAYYGEAREVTVDELLKLGGNRRRAPACAALLTRLRDGLHRSPHTKRGLKTIVPR